MKVLFLVTIVCATIYAEEEASSRLFQAQPEPVDLGLIYDFFTASEDNISRFQVASVAQFIFNAIGYVVSTFLWTSYRGDDLPAPAATGVDPVTALIDGLVSDQNAATVIALAAGYAIAAAVVYIVISQLGNPSTLAKNNRQGSGFYHSDTQDQLTDRVVNADDITRILDGVFSPSGIIRFLTLQSILQISIFLFWTVMRLLPKRVTTVERHHQETQYPADLSSNKQYDVDEYGNYYGNYNDVNLSF